jgi:hypothetical protein
VRVERVTTGITGYDVWTAKVLFAGDPVDTDQLSRAMRNARRRASAAIRRDLAERGLLGVGYRLGLDVVHTEVRADGVPVSIQFRERDNEPAAR